MKRALLSIALPAALFAAPAALIAGNPATATVHTVKEGETLNGIANRAGVDKSIIAIANGLTEPYNVQKGQRLQIPRQRSHKVKPGESLSRIAEKYQVPQSQIAVANGLAKPNDIRIGQKLIIPAVFKTPVRIASRSIAPRSPYFRRPHDGKVLRAWPNHDGVDYAVNTGDMVRASASGMVSVVNTGSTRFGRVVMIDHANGYQSVYGHLSRVTVKEGEYVKSGERIGLAGDAGGATRPELHFQIRKDGKKIDPASKLPKR
jgi:murein DD-endopeptidase MepM/ murein hydrolase activator NlpD